MLRSSVQVKCKFCGNTFRARPEIAVCQKCGRPANRDLAAQWRALSFMLPPLGLINAYVIKPHSPVAAIQGFVASVIGFAGYGFLYGAVQIVSTL